MEEKELKKKAFLEKAEVNKMNFELHTKLIKKHLILSGRKYHDDLKSFYEKLVIGDFLLMQLMDYAEEYAERREIGLHGNIIKKFYEWLSESKDYNHSWILDKKIEAFLKYKANGKVSDKD